MDTLTSLLDVALHLDQHLLFLLDRYGVWLYGILALIVFAETGLVVTPFLPGDSLLFVAGALAATGKIDAAWLCLILIVAAVTGNTVNYWIGRYLGPRVFQWPDSRFFSQRSLQRTQVFYVKHGGKTLVLSRFVPILRTFAPFVAGIGRMAHGRFQVFNIAGALAWVISLTFAGYFFGNISLIKNNISVVVLVIVVLSLIPVAIEFVRQRRAA
jgi:membrane-associated protein